MSKSSIWKMWNAIFGMQPPLDFSKLPEPPTEPGVRLVLKCKACGRERSDIFPKVYCDLNTVRDEKKKAEYDPIIIPQRCRLSEVRRRGPV